MFGAYSLVAIDILNSAQYQCFFLHFIIAFSEELSKHLK